MDSRPGYTLIQPTVNPAAPGWALAAIKATQPTMDYQYLHGAGNSLDHFYTLFDAWLTTETQARASSSDPAHYTPRPFVGIVPQREIYDYFDGEWMGDPRSNGLNSRFAPPDPAIVAPVLPPWIAPAPATNGFITAAGTSQDPAVQQFAATVSLLIQINKKLDAIGARMGITFAILLLLFAAPSLRADVTIACSPQPLATTRSIGEKVMGPWQCWITNDGASAFTLTPSKFFQSILAMRPIGPNVANQILSDSVNGLPQSKVLRAGKIAVSLAAIGYGLYSGNATLPLAVGLGIQNAPQVLSVIEGTVPTSAPFAAGQFVATVTIPPNGEAPPVIVYAMKTKNPSPLTVRIP